MKSISRVLFLALVILAGAKVFAQEEKEVKDVQVTLVPPVGTAGVDAVKYCNRFSLNIIAGLNGGVDGCEIGSVVNINKGYVDGAQLAGAVNYTTLDSKGAIIAGATNINGGNVNGGVVSGAFNYVGGNSQGAMISSGANYTAKYAEGASISAALNYSKSMHGLQLSTVNVVKDKMEGSQIGIVNIAGEVRGLQLGIINVCNNNNTDSVIPIGLFSVVKGGYYAFELSTNEVFQTSLAYKMGIKKFYTIFRIGVGWDDGKSVYNTGLGFGSIIPIKDSHNLNIEAIADQIVYDNEWGGDNMLFNLNLSYQYQVNERLAVKAGPVFRTCVTQQKIDNAFNTVKVPYTLFDKESNDTKTSGWIGFDVGVLLSL